MNKTVYFYDNLSGGGVEVVTSITQLARKTEMSYRSIQRKLFGNKNTQYYDPKGRFRIGKTVIEQDGRRNNGNKDISK